MLPGSDLRALARRPPEKRTVFSEYHATGSTSAGYMVRRGDWKLVHYVGHAPQIFDLGADPRETRDLAGRAETTAIQAELDGELRLIVDSDAANAMAFADQDRRIQQLGGAEVIRAKSLIENALIDFIGL